MDRYLSDKKEQRINRMQFFFRILSIVALFWMIIWLLYSCFFVDFMSGSCPVSHIFNWAWDVALYWIFFLFIFLFFPISILIKKRIHDLWYNWGIIFWIFRGSVLLLLYLFTFGISWLPESIADKIGFTFLYVSTGFIFFTIVYLLFRRWNSWSNHYGKPE